MAPHEVRGSRSKAPFERHPSQKTTKKTAQSLESRSKRSDFRQNRQGAIPLGCPFPGAEVHLFRPIFVSSRQVKAQQVQKRPRKDPEKSKQVQQSPNTSKQVPKSPNKSKQVLNSPKKSKQVQASPEKSKKVQTSPKKTQNVPTLGAPSSRTARLRRPSRTRAQGWCVGPERRASLVRSRPATVVW